MIFDCFLRIEVGMKCVFEVGLFCGDSVSFMWIVFEGDICVFVYSDKKRI